MPRDFDERMSAEPVVGEVLALRSFLIDPDTWTLGGLTFHQEIAPGVNVAQCGLVEADGHVAPEEGCLCGWYAYDEVRHWGGLAGGHPHKPVGLEVSAVVRLSGKIIVCERGLKAEGMEVVAVATEPSNASFIHGVLPGVEVFWDEASMLKRYPLQRLSRGDEDGGEEGVGVPESLTFLGIPVTAAARTLSQAMGWVRSGWATLTSYAAFWTAWDVVKWLFRKTLVIAAWAALIWMILGFSREMFPPGSVGGFGALIPFGVLIALSPILNLWRSVGGLVVYLALLNYGIVGSEDALDAATKAASMTNGQAGMILFILYLLPTALILAHVTHSIFSERSLRSINTAGAGMVSGGAVAAGSSLVIGGMGRGKIYSPVGRNRLPKKVKSEPPRGGDASPDSTEEGGQHG